MAEMEATAGAWLRRNLNTNLLQHESKEVLISKVCFLVGELQGLRSQVGKLEGDAVANNVEKRWLQVEIQRLTKVVDRLEKLNDQLQDDNFVLAIGAATVHEAMQGDELTCRVCCNRKRNVVLLPCTHGHYCDLCIAQLRKQEWPTCRKEILDTVRVIL